MELRLLGFFECIGSDGVPVTIPGQSARAVLAMLGLRPGAAVLTGEIIEGLWGYRLPQDPDATLQVVMSRLRHALGADRESLVHIRGGYRLALADGAVDVDRARRALASGLRMLQDGDIPGAAGVLEEGLAEWRHDLPLAEFADRPFGPGAAGNLMVLRAELVHAANEAALQLLRPRDVVARTEAMLALDPWREDLVLQLMTALRDLGRRGEALAAYTSLASHLRADFGADPAPELQLLEEELRGDTEPSGTAGAPRAPSSGGDPEMLTRSIRSALAELVEEEPDPLIRGRLELALAQAEQLAGLPGWQDTLRRAAAAARSAGDTAGAARCALGATYGWTVTPGRPSQERLDDLERVVRADGLPDDLKARALAAYALEMAFSAPLGQRLTLTSRALRIARRSGHPSLLLWVLNHRFNAIWAPDTLALRRRETEEACELAAQTGHLPAQAVAAGFAMAAAVESGDMEGADRHLARFESAARQLAWPVFLWGVAVHTSWRAVLAGDLVRAERLAGDAHSIGREGGRPEADLIHGLQMWGIRWLQGRLGDHVGGVGTIGSLPPGTVQAMRAVELLQSGVIAEGGAALDAAWSSGAIRAQPHDQMFLATLTLWAEVATVCAKEEVAAGIYEMLLPYQHQFVFTGAAVYGPVAGPLAALASVLGNPAVGRRHRELGRRQCAAMGAGVFAERLDPPVIAPI